MARSLPERTEAAAAAWSPGGGTVPDAVPRCLACEPFPPPRTKLPAVSPSPAPALVHPRPGRSTAPGRSGAQIGKPPEAGYTATMNASRLGDVDIHLFGEGTHGRIYDK